MPANSDTPKAMDVLHPSQAAQPTTSKPVIVSNRPMIAEDPMIAHAVAAVDIEQPAGAPAFHDEAPLAEADTRHEKTVALPKVDDTADDDATKPAEIHTAKFDKPTSIKAVSTSASPEGTPEEPAITTPTANEHETSIHDESSPKNGLSSNVVAIDGETADRDVDAAEENRRQEIESLIAEGRYAVPIGQVAKRRQRTAIVVILIIVLLFVAFDVVLDVGLVHVPHVPHTSFFG